MVPARTASQGRHDGGDRTCRCFATPVAQTAARCGRHRRTTTPHAKRVKMTQLRPFIARRLKEAQSITAMLTTFNEVDIARSCLRNQYKDRTRSATASSSASWASSCAPASPLKKF
jgi:pyruvate/2-oxoglutarate dehydrogenase complex dihydrolipoamide acyltransferase (E2) component